MLARAVRLRRARRLIEARAGVRAQRRDKAMKSLESARDALVILSIGATQVAWPVI